MNAKLLGMLGLLSMSAYAADEKKAAEPPKTEEKKEAAAAPAADTADAGTAPAKAAGKKKAK